MKPTVLFAATLAAAGCAADNLVGVVIPPPPIPLAPPTRGVQLTFGPFDVPTGDVQLCRTLKLDNDKPLVVNRLELKMLLGSHHFILFRAQPLPDGNAGTPRARYYQYPDRVFECKGTVNFDEWDFVMDVNKTGGLDWTVGEGQAFVFPPHAQLMMQSHFLNASLVTSPDGAYDVLNLYEVPDGQYRHELKGMFTVDTRIKIPPKAVDWRTQKDCSFSRTVHVTAMTGHFHQQGRTFRVEKLDAPTGFTAGEIYCSGPDCADPAGSSSNWDHPLFKTFDPPLLLNGSMDASLEGVRFSCSYDNIYVNAGREIGFGGLAEIQEHCNLFFQYYEHDPVQKGALACAEGQGGW